MGGITVPWASALRAGRPSLCLSHSSEGFCRLKVAAMKAGLPSSGNLSFVVYFFQCPMWFSLVRINFELRRVYLVQFLGNTGLQCMWPDVFGHVKTLWLMTPWFVLFVVSVKHSCSNHLKTRITLRRHDLHFTWKCMKFPQKWICAL